MKKFVGFLEHGMDYDTIAGILKSNKTSCDIHEFYIQYADFYFLDNIISLHDQQEKKQNILKRTKRKK